MMCERCGGPHQILVCPTPYDEQRPARCFRCDGSPCSRCGREYGPEEMRRRSLAAKYDVTFDPNDPTLDAKVARVEAAGEWWKTANESEQSLERADAADHDIADPIDPLDVVIDGIKLGVLMWCDEVVRLRAGVSVIRTNNAVIAVRSREDWFGHPDGGGGWLGREDILGWGKPFEFTPAQRAAVDERLKQDAASASTMQETGRGE